MNKKLVLLSTCLLAASTVTAQKRVTGHVADSNGDPIVGAAVKVEGTKLFTRTDAQGNFTFTSLPAGAKRLKVSYIGMKPQNVSVFGNLNIVLHDNQLEEAVVVGYGTARKMGTVVGTVSKVTSDKIENKPVTTALDAMQGKVAGVQISNNSGDVGSISGASTTVRGRGSLNGGNAPLYVVDGQPVDGTVFYMLNPNDIESYSVMRDASATSIYGSRAANGVIFVTTKRGKKGEKAQVKVGQSIGWSMLAKRVGDPMSAAQYLDYAYEMGTIDGDFFEKWASTGTNTDWTKYWFRKSAPIYNTNFSIQGASDRTHYYISGSYMKKGSLIPTSKFKRYTGRVNLDSRINDWMRVGVNLGLNYDERAKSSIFGGLYYGNPIMETVIDLPFVDPWDEDGNRKPQPNVPFDDHYSQMYLQPWRPKNVSDARLVGSAFVELTPIKGLTVKSLFGADLMDQRAHSMILPTDPQLVADGRPGASGREESFGRFSTFTSTNTAEYKWSLNDDHRFTFLLGQEGIKEVANSFSAYTSNFEDERFMDLQYGNDAKPQNQTSGRTEVQYLSFFGRVDYDFMHRYYANFTVRNDRSSKFGSKNRSANFYSGGLMWRMKDEKFLENVDWLNDLRFKASVGSTGNSAGIGAYTHLSSVNVGKYNEKNAYTLSSIGNDDLGWETQIQTTVGFNARLFDRWNVEANYYRRKTNDMLMTVPVPYTTGFSSRMLNLGSMLNSGFELQTDVDAVKGWNGLFVNVYANVTYNRAKITKLFYGMKEWTNPGAGINYIVGKDIYYYMPVRGGVDPADGKPYWLVPDPVTHKPQKDENGNYITTKEYTSRADLAIITDKKLHAPVFGGFGLNASWKGFTLNADFNYTLGKWMGDYMKVHTLSYSNFPTVNADKEMLNSWRKPGDITKIPAFGEPARIDNTILYNSSFIRLKNLSLSYDLPAYWMSTTGFIQNIRLTASARNLFTITKYPGADPELASSGSEGNAMPNTREYSMGVEFTF